MQKKLLFTYEATYDFFTLSYKWKILIGRLKQLVSSYKLPTDTCWLVLILASGGICSS